MAVKRFPRKLTGTEMSDEYRDNFSLLAAVNQVISGDFTNWHIIKEHYFINRHNDCGIPGFERLQETKKLIEKLYKNREILKDNESLSKLIDFLNTENGENLLLGSVTNADGRPYRIDFVEWINYFVDMTLANPKNNKIDLFSIDSGPYELWNKIGNIYSVFKFKNNIYYTTPAVNESGVEYNAFAEFTTDENNKVTSVQYIKRAPKPKFRDNQK